MLKIRWFVIIAVLVAAGSFCVAETSSESSLFSPAVGNEFHRIAKELIYQKEITDAEVEQAMSLLMAAHDLEATESELLPDIIKTASLHSSKDYSSIVHAMFLSYVDRDVDLYYANLAIDYMLTKLNSRGEREELLSTLSRQTGEKNKHLASDIYTRLANLFIEKTDFESAAKLLSQAWDLNKYNLVAFEKLMELVGDQIHESAILAYLRLRITENPMDVDAVKDFADYCRKVEAYDLSLDAYEYAVNLFEYLNSGKGFSEDLYVSWMLACYNSSEPSSCLKINQLLDNLGEFSIASSSIAAQAAEQAVGAEQAKMMFEQIEQKANEYYNSGKIGAEALAWFYIFGKSDNDKAIDFSNKAYSQNPESSIAAGLLAYSLVLNDQAGVAKTLIENYGDLQVVKLAQGTLELNEGEKEKAVATLKEAIEIDPSSMAAYRAKELLKENESEYIAAKDPELIVESYKTNYEGKGIPEFRRPSELVSFRLNARGGKFAYGNDFNIALELTNKSSEPLVISDRSMIRGMIEIEAKVSDGLELDLGDVITKRVLPSDVIKPDSTMIVRLGVESTKLWEILDRHPQASLKLEFTGYIDGVTAGGVSRNGLADIAPATIEIRRTPINLTASFLQNRLDSMTTGQQSQLFRTTSLFTGLLKEQQAFAGKVPSYALKYDDWMPQMLRSAVVFGLQQDKWPVKALVTSQLTGLKMNYEITRVLSSNLNDENWPLRLITLYVLTKADTDDFSKVLDYYARNDANWLVKELAGSLLKEQ
jgi:tetratricopeptide (TPR) repeat protein